MMILMVNQFSFYSLLFKDCESVVGPRVGLVDLYKANHHGSDTSSSSNFMYTLQPQVLHHNLE